MSITIDELEAPSNTHSRYNVTIFNNQIDTVLTNTPTIVDEWISEILYIHRHRLNRLIVGLDVEWRPNFNRNTEYPVAILQLCVGRRCLIFQLIYTPTIPQSLVNFLNNPNFSFVGVGIDEDVEKLLLDYDLRVANTVDLRPLAAQQLNMNELRNAGLKGLASEVLGIEIVKPKRVTMSRWDLEWLTYEQIQYACVDAFLSFEMGKQLISGN